VNPLHTARGDANDLRIYELFDVNEYLWVTGMNCEVVDGPGVVFRLQVSLGEDGEPWATVPMMMSTDQIATLLAYATYIKDPDEALHLFATYKVPMPTEDDRADKLAEEMNKGYECKVCGKRHYG
jgi:hypothetical protein